MKASFQVDLLLLLASRIGSLFSYFFFSELEMMRMVGFWYPVNVCGKWWKSCKFSSLKRM